MTQAMRAAQKRQMRRPMPNILRSLSRTRREMRCHDCGHLYLLPAEGDPHICPVAFGQIEVIEPEALCEDCPPRGYPTDDTRCRQCPLAQRSTQ